MLIHSVYFWLKEQENPDARKSLLEGLHSLQGIKPLHSSYVGGPAETRRPVIDSTYDFALVLIFDSLEDHDKYQVDPVHLKFIEEKAPLWARVQIYDSLG